MFSYNMLPKQGPTSAQTGAVAPVASNDSWKIDPATGQQYGADKLWGWTSDLGVTPNTQDFSYNGLGSDYFSQQAHAAGMRTAPATNFSDANAMRAQQQAALGLQQQTALGNVPSIAQQQLQQGAYNSMQAQNAMAASARGGARGLASATSAAQNANAGIAAQYSGQNQMLRAGEMANARNSYMAGASNMRGMDFGQQQYMAQLQQQQQQLNNARIQGMYGYGQKAALGDQIGGQAYEAQLAGNVYGNRNFDLREYQNANQQAMQSSAVDYDNVMSAVKGSAGVVAGIAKMAAGA